MKTFRHGQVALFQIDAHSRIESVERILEHLESFLPHAKAQAFLRTEQQLRSARDWRDKELYESELEVMKIDWDGQFPAYFYGSLLVLLWGELEIIFYRFAAEVKSVQGTMLGFDDIKGSSTYGRLRKFVQAVLGIRLAENSVMEDLEFLRNIYAHHGGNVQALAGTRASRSREIARQHGLSFSGDDYLLVSGKFVLKMVTQAYDVAHQLREAHPSTEPDLIECNDQSGEMVPLP